MWTWSKRCPSCGATQGVWPNLPEEPRGTGPLECWGCDAVSEDFVWDRQPYLRFDRLCGFSTSESDFTPHWNRAFGKKVRSLAEMKALQAQHGTTDAVVKGDGVERHAPRDILTRIRRHAEVGDRVAAGMELAEGGVRGGYQDLEEDQG